MTDHVVVLPPILIPVHYRLIVVRNDVEHDQLSVDVIHLLRLTKKKQKMENLKEDFFFKFFVRVTLSRLS
jgi:hypothetical protein